MAKQSGLIKQWQASQARREMEVRRHARLFMLDLVTIALGRMGFREAKFREFDKVLNQVSEEYAAAIIDDSATDADLWYSKDTMDREIKQYVGSLFVPYEERYK